MKTTVLTFSIFLMARAPALLLDFGDGTGLPDYITGTGSGTQTVGAQYRYTNVGSQDGNQVNVILTLGELNGGAVYSNQNVDPVGDASNGNAVFAPSFNYNIRSYAEFRLQFEENGTGTASSVGTLLVAEDLSLVFKDIDSSTGTSGFENYTDMIYIENGVAATYTLDKATKLVVNEFDAAPSGFDYQTFSLDFETDLSSEVGLSDTDPNQFQNTVQFDFATLGTDGVRMAFGTMVGLGAGNNTGPTPRRALIDGSGTFIFDDPDLPIVVPEPATAVLAGLLMLTTIPIFWTRRSRTSASRSRWS